MSGIVQDKANWQVKIIKDNNPEQDVKVFAWNATQTSSYSTYTTDSNGSFETDILYEKKDIDGTDVTTTSYNPFVLSVVKYGLKYLSMTTGFKEKRIDTFYLYTNPYITETDASTVSNYTGINIDHSNRIIELTEDHTIQEIYDYTQYKHTEEPQKDYPEGILLTSDGTNFTALYTLVFNGGIVDNTNIKGNIRIIKECNISNLNLIGDIHVNIDSDATIALIDSSVSGKVYNDNSDNKLTVNISSKSSVVADNPGQDNGQVNLQIQTKIKIQVYDVITKDPVANARVYIKDTTNNVDILNDSVDSNGYLEVDYIWHEDVNITGNIRRATDGILYKPAVIGGKIVKDGYSTTVFMIRDE